MKRCLLLITALLLSAALVFAQAQPEEPQNPGRFPPGPGPGFDSGPEQSRDNLTIQGTLGFVNGQIALKSGGTTYYVWGLDRLFGFVDGLKEGAAVTLEGYAEEISLAPEYRLFLAEKLVFNGREYADLRPGGPLPQRPGERAHAGTIGSPRGFPHSGGMKRDRRSPPPNWFFDDDNKQEKEQ
jgi:hypothetical protein